MKVMSIRQKTGGLWDKLGVRSISDLWPNVTVLQNSLDYFGVRSNLVMSL